MSTGGSTWSTIPGSTLFSSRSAWPSRDRSGSSRPLPPARCASWPRRRVVPGSTDSSIASGARLSPVSAWALFCLGPATDQRVDRTLRGARPIGESASAAATNGLPYSGRRAIGPCCAECAPRPFRSSLRPVTLVGPDDEIARFRLGSERAGSQPDGARQPDLELKVAPHEGD